MTIEGIIYKIFDVEQKTDRFKVRNFVLKTEDRYSPFISFQLTNKNTEVFEEDGIALGDEVEVSFDVGGKEYEARDGSGTKYFNVLTAWKILIK